MKQIFFSLMLAWSFSVNAQNKPKEILFTIDDKPYYTDEFERVYKKNLDLVKDESQKDLNQYLELFVGYKLKVLKANKLGLQNKPQYQNELKGYRTQLSKNYTSDSKVTSALVKEGYERMKKEIKASHILLMVNESASPEDTLKAYKKCLDIRQRAINGEDFAKLAQEFSEDPSAKENFGDLGYFTSFRMVYAFESAAYKTAKGSISMPTRTRFGFHLIKVTDERENRGDLTVAHIMILKSADDKSDADPNRASNTIQEVYKKIKQGENFEELAKQFSEDKSSASKGGVLNRFGSGQLSSEEFESTAFSLTKDNPISAPFETKFGWHIVKLINKFPLKSYEESKVELENKISKDDRSRIITNTLTEKLRKKYNVKRDNKTYETISKLVTNAIYDNKWTLPENTNDYTNKLFSIENKDILGLQFLSFLNTSQTKEGLTITPLSRLIDVLYNKFVDEEINQYYIDNLENEFPEFAAVVEEYRDGLLLFDLMEKEIWERSKTDSLGLKAFYETQLGKHKWKPRLDVIITSSTKMDVIKKAQMMLKTGKSPQEIKDALNTKDQVDVMSSQSTLEIGSIQLPKDIKQEVGISEISKQGDYYFVTNVLKVLPESDKTYEECKGKIINDYQQYLEQNWIKELNKECTVKVNQATFEKVKNSISKQ